MQLTDKPQILFKASISFYPLLDLFPPAHVDLSKFHFLVHPLTSLLINGLIDKQPKGYKGRGETKISPNLENLC